MTDVRSLSDIALYHNDTEKSLRLFFSRSNPQLIVRFPNYLPIEIERELKERLTETEMRSILVIIARVDAALCKDYAVRCKLKKPDNVSIAFRKSYAIRKKRPRLEEDILDVWAQNVDPPTRRIISGLRGILNFRHWLAHGRYWNPGQKYGYEDAYLLADSILTGFQLYD